MTDHFVDAKGLKNFGFLMGGVFSLIASILFYKGKITASATLYAIAGVFLLLALIRPSLLNGAYTRWMKFADAIGRFNSKVILSLIYTIFFSLSRIFLFFFRKDLLERKFDSTLDSYWKDHEPMRSDPKQYEQQF